MSDTDSRRHVRLGLRHAAGAVLERSWMMVREPFWIALRRYPSWVTAGDRRARVRSVPIFYWHSAEPESLEERLCYLADNGYETLSLDTLYAHLTQGAPVPERSVVLTFDDGLLSIWTCAAPLLEKYGMRATVFVIPGYTRESTEARPTWRDVWEGRCDRAVVESLSDEGPEGLMNWEELRRLESGGHVEVQSHTRFHRRVFTSGRIVDFLSPAYWDSFMTLPVDEKERIGLLAAPSVYPWGLPLYPHRPLAATDRIVYDDRSVREACLAHVRDRGLDFFAYAGWRQELRRLARRNNGGEARRGTEADLREELRLEFHGAMEDIAEHLEGKRVRHLCYPFGRGGRLAAEVARECGYETAFWLDVPGKNENLPRGDAYSICRIKHDWILRLPGKGRRSLTTLLGGKIARRLAGGPHY